MEEDDEFGDLYTDVLRPLEASVQSQMGGAGAPSRLHGRPVDLNVNSDDEEILYGASDSKTSFPNSNSNTAIPLKLSAPIQGKILPDSGSRPEGRGLDLNLSTSRILGDGGLGFGRKGLEKGDGVKLLERGSGMVDFMEEDDLNIVVEERDNKDDDMVEKDADLKDKNETVYRKTEQNEKEDASNLLGQSSVGGFGTEQMIPGLSGRLENRGGSNFEDEWDSDESEDDLQIVLNESHGPIGMERMPGVSDDEDGEPLVIVADNGDASHHPHHQPQMILDEQEWAGEEGGPGAGDGEKELGDAAKAGLGGGTATPPAVPPRIGYSNHMYHHPYHSQFKYVRPGVAPLPGAAPSVSSGGVLGQVRPPPIMGAVTGRGRGDWRPAGLKGPVPMQKGFHPGYGVPAWGANAAGRGYGSGLDFTLPSHKTIFEVDIDGFEEKPWKLPGMDVTDFFNFGLNEESWKDYCKQLEQLRLETTMQSKIRVYESGRAEQDYDPDLPPELAAAVGGQDISSENANPGKIDAGSTDLARSNARGRPPVLIGRPIPVETGSSDRLPSMDTRRPRVHDLDAIIEIICHGSADDPEIPEQENEPAGKDVDDVEEIDDPRQDDEEQINRSPRTYKHPNREHVSKRTCGDESVRDPDQRSVSEELDQTDRQIEMSNEDERSSKRRGSHSPNMSGEENNREKENVDDQNEEFNSEDEKQNPPLSLSRAVGSDEEQAVTLGDDAEESLMDDRGSDMEKDEMAVDATPSDTLEDGKLMDSITKGNISSCVEQLSQENVDGEETVRSRENSKERSGSSKDHRKIHDHFGDDDLQDRHLHANNAKEPLGGGETVHRKGRNARDETGRHSIAGKGIEDSHSHRGGDPSSTLHRPKNENDKRDSDMSEGNWRRRDDDLHGKRVRTDDGRKKDHGGEIGSKSRVSEIGSKNRVKVRESERNEKDDRHHIRNEIDNSSWRGANHDQDLGSRQRGREDNVRIRNDKVGDLHHRRRKEAASVSREHAEKEDPPRNYREGSSHRKRERDDSSDQRKRDDISDLRKRDDNIKPKDDEIPYVSQKREGSIQKERGDRQRDRDEWNRPKQSLEENYSRREREETRPVMRSVRTAEDKTWTSHSRGKDDYKVSGREHHSKDGGRDSDQLKRRDRSESEKISQHRSHEDVYARGNQTSNDEKRARPGRSSTNDGRVVHASESSRFHEHRHDVNRKSKESESGDHNSLTRSKRNDDEHGGPTSEKASGRGRSERESGKDDAHASHQSSRRHREEASSDEEQAGARKGRSKLERWTSHKENDYSSTSMSSSSLKKGKDPVMLNNLGASAASKPSEEQSRKAEEKPRPSVDDKDTSVEPNNATPKVVDDKHLDTVAKLKKRSERFKLPMPSEKDALSIKKMESEPLPSVSTENHQDSEIKSERPARKRRWTGN